MDVMPAITDQFEDAEFREPFDINEPEPEPEEAVMAEPEPFAPDPNSTLTEEQQRILARSRSSNGLAADLAQRALRKQAEQAAAETAAVAPRVMQPPPPSTYRGDDPDDSCSVRRVA